MHLKKVRSRLDDVKTEKGYPAREVHFDAKDTDILRAGTLSLCLEDREGGGGG